MKNLFSICVLAVVLSGCASPKSSRGWVLKAEVGKQYPDFVYVDERGVQRSLRNLKGDFTVLAFTRCDQDAHGPATAALQTTVAENDGARFVRVVGVDVHWFEGQCDHGRCHLVEDNRDMFSICDATGAVRRLYGVNDGVAAVVIGPDGRVFQIAAQIDDRLFREQLKAAVIEESNRISQELSEKYGNI